MSSVYHSGLHARSQAMRDTAQTEQPLQTGSKVGDGTAVNMTILNGHVPSCCLLMFSISMQSLGCASIIDYRCFQVLASNWGSCSFAFGLHHFCNWPDSWHGELCFFARIGSNGWSYPKIVNCDAVCWIRVSYRPQCDVSCCSFWATNPSVCETLNQ